MIAMPRCGKGVDFSVLDAQMVDFVFLSFTSAFLVYTYRFIDLSFLSLFSCAPSIVATDLTTDSQRHFPLPCLIHHPRRFTFHAPHTTSAPYSLSLVAHITLTPMHT